MARRTCMTRSSCTGPAHTRGVRNFTLGHELGHHLVDANASNVDWLADQPSPMQQLETICDRVAQALLLPNAVVAAHLSRPVRARSVLDLYE